MSRLIKVLASLGALVLLAVAIVWLLNVRDEADVTKPFASAQSTPEFIARGAYLARAGNCMGCHTARGGANYAGGRGIDTPFGTVFTSNLTPDEKTGLGTWSPAHFWRAMHNGRSKSGRLLYPAFPYTNYTEVTRADSDALFAFLRSLPAVEQANKSHALQFPFQSQAALAVWRALYFKPGNFTPEPNKNAEWNRGAYLVTGLGHCSACHTARNALGATDGLNLGGGLIPQQNWFAPSLIATHEAGVADWSTEEVVRLLKTGVSNKASVSGPMAEVVLGGTQYLQEGDLRAMAVYLKSLPAATAAAADEISVMSKLPAGKMRHVTEALAARGAKIYEQNCAQCHGDDGKGVPNAYPALAGNRAVTLPETVNLVQIVLNGGYAPATAGNPRPFGMPPFVLVLDDTDVAAVLTHIRGSWGNQASAVTTLDINRIRSATAASR